MRWLAILLLTFVSAIASASPYDVGWATFGISLGASPDLSGSLADRVEREPCGGECPLSTRFAIGGGLQRWGAELQLAASPVVDTGAMDYRDRDRHAFRVGPLVRYTVFRRVGFDLSVRAGIQLGALLGRESTTSSPDPDCPLGREGMCPPIEVTYEPDSYFLAAVPLGATLRLGARTRDRGFFAVFADLDYTLTRISFPGDARTGMLRTLSFGFMFGTMFDLH